MNKNTVVDLLKRLAAALSTGDLKGVARCWATPALLLSDEGATVLADASEIEKLFAQAREGYQSRGLTSTKPDLERVERLSDKLASVDVRWPAFDASGREQSSERSHYLLQLGKDGQPYIRVALTRTW